MPIQMPAQPSAEKPYVFFVDDNFRHMKEEERYKRGDDATFKRPGPKCKSIVDDFLEGERKPEMSSKELTINTACLEGIQSAVRKRVSMGLRSAAL